MSNRYLRNKSTISEEEQSILAQKRVCIIGCGGLGGYIAEMLCRIGVINLSLVDFDIIDESNLNRQIVALTDNLGKSKVKELAKRCYKINPEMKIRIINEPFQESNAGIIIQDTDLVMDALDNIKARKVLQAQCEKYNKPFIHGAIAGFYGHICTIFPGDRSLDRIYPENEIKTLEKELGNPSFMPAHVASIQVSEAIKYLLGKGEILKNKLLMVNLLNNEFEIIDI